jgi:protein-S-isoprenylcysteine O-methyltransferase Ste14
VGQGVSNTLLSPVVRHPMCSSIGVMSVGASLFLGSYAGVGVALIMLVMLSVRAVLEQRTLREELEGYAEYMKKVRYSLIPGIW